MEEPVKESVSDGRRHTVRWADEEWDRIERAAEKLAAEVNVPVAPVDLIRGSTMARVQEILGTA